MSSEETGIYFINNVEDTDSLNILDYLYYYNGAGVAVGDINNDGRPDIYFTANQGGNKLYLNKGNFEFEDITNKAGVSGNADWTTGVCMADVNGDRFLDIYVSTVGNHRLPDDTLKVFFPHSNNQLFINNGNGTFTEKAKEYNLNQRGYCTQAAFFDYDKDGDLDMFQLHHSIHQTSVYGDTSLRRMPNAASGSKLMRNDGNYFTDVTNGSGIYNSALGYGLGIAIADFNNDGWPDIYEGNDFHESDYYYINQKDGSFKEMCTGAFGHTSRFSMGNDAADINNDGWTDLITMDMLSPDEKVLKSSAGDQPLDIYYQLRLMGYHYQYEKNTLQLNTGAGTRFSDVALYCKTEATDWSWAPLIADYDNDGYTDIFITTGIKKRLNDLDYLKFTSSIHHPKNKKNARNNDKIILSKMPSGKWHNYMWKGIDGLTFTDKSTDWGFAEPNLSNGAAYADLDNDGDLDIIINHLNAKAAIYKNNTPQSDSTHYLKISLAGSSKNQFGIGAKIFVFANKKTYYKEQQPSRGFLSSCEPVINFGLAACKQVDSIIIIWPDNKYQLVKAQQTQQTLEIKYADAADSLHNQEPFIRHLLKNDNEKIFEDITIQTGVNFAHKENLSYFDFNFEGFIPHKISTEGPHVEVADVNADGLDDFFVCGAKNQSGELFVQNANGTFRQSVQPFFVADALHEQVDAAFFDADNDGDKDLYVVSGGNEFLTKPEKLQDALYLNNGKGIFTKSAGLPYFSGNKSVVKAADMDSDGDLDLFVGGRSNPQLYGNIPSSYLLINDGKGRFDLKTKILAPELEKVGMITDACWADVNGDKTPDLIVAGEWMSVTIFINSKGVLKKQTFGLSTTTGWWSSINPTDINEDGFTDFVVGNYGLNSKLTASQQYPLKMYVNDFDRNGDPEQLLAVQKNGNYYPFLKKEDMEVRLPYLRKKFLGYASMANKTIEEIFGEKLVDAQLLHVATLQSVILMNDGKGGFLINPLPPQFQWQPMFSFFMADFNHDGANDILGGGSFFGVTPYEGRYDALSLVVGWGNTNNGFSTPSVYPSELLLKGEVKDIEPIKIRGESCLIIARNNEKLVFLRY